MTSVSVCGFRTSELYFVRYQGGIRIIREDPSSLFEVTRVDHLSLFKIPSEDKRDCRLVSVQIPREDD